MKRRWFWGSLLLVSVLLVLVIWRSADVVAAQERNTLAEAAGVRTALREINRALTAKESEEPEEQLVVLLAEDVELIGTADELMVLRRVYTARTLAGENVWESLVRGFVASYLDAYHLDFDGLRFFLDYQVPDEPDIDEGVDWEALYEEQAREWDADWFGQWQLEPVSPQAEMQAAKYEQEFSSTSELALASRMVDLAETRRAGGSEETLIRDIRELYRDYLLSDAAWAAEVEWVFSELFWDWPNAYTISSAGNLVVPAGVAVALLVWDPISLELDHERNRFGRETLVWYTDPYFETEGPLHLVFQQDSLGWFVTAMSVEWSVEWLVALLQAEEMIGF